MAYLDTQEHCALCQLRGASRTVGSGLRNRSTQTMGVLFVRWKTLVKIEDATETFETENGRESLQVKCTIAFLTNYTKHI